MTLNMFRKLGLLFLAANTFAIAASAQIQFGLKAGLNIAELNTSNSQYAAIAGGTPQSIKNYPRTLFNAGALVDVPLNKKFILQPELSFSMQGATGNPNQGYQVNATETYKYNFINLPVLIKYMLPMGIYAETGPQLGYLIAAHIDEVGIGAMHKVTYNVKDQLKSTEISWALGVGYQAPFNVGIDVRYNLGLTSYNNASATGLATSPIQNGNLKNSVVQIGVYYLFGKTKEPAPEQ